MITLLCLLIVFIALYAAILLAELTPLRSRLRPFAWAQLRWSAALGALVPFLLLVGSAAGRSTLPPPAEASLQAIPGEAAGFFPSLPFRRSGEILPVPEKSEEPDIHWLVHYHGARHGVDPLLVLAVIQEESQFDPRAVSPRGAMGLMQLTQDTAQHLGLRDPFDIRENIEGGIRYLQFLLERHDWDLRLALASYNAGPSKVDRYRGIPPYPETQRFIHKVMARYQSLQRMAEVFRHWRSQGPATSLLALVSPEEEGAAARGWPATVSNTAPSRPGGF
ncbi:MAG: transglycosylase SLT domain-containing protein [Nitrospinota bacterium]